MNIYEMKKEDFAQVPIREWGDTTEMLFDGIVVIPSDRKHDSGFMCMDFVGCCGGEPIIRTGAYSDVVHFDGIGGYGEWKGHFPKQVEPKAWCIDCLPCGYLRIFCSGKKIKIGNGCSDQFLYTTSLKKSQI